MEKGLEKTTYRNIARLTFALALFILSSYISDPPYNYVIQLGYWALIGLSLFDVSYYYLPQFFSHAKNYLTLYAFVFFGLIVILGNSFLYWKIGGSPGFWISLVSSVIVYCGTLVNAIIKAKK